MGSMLACKSGLPLPSPKLPAGDGGAPQHTQSHRDLISMPAALVKEQGQGSPASSHQILGCRAS